MKKPKLLGNYGMDFRIAPGSNNFFKKIKIFEANNELTKQNVNCTYSSAWRKIYTFNCIIRKGGLKIRELNFSRS